ncbi:MAG: hypothetical protein KJ069_15020 [Anaerolineae bacterium]|nr:hypothetical protein [Anaerolineae bacterium]
MTLMKCLFHRGLITYCMIVMLLIGCDAYTVTATPDSSTPGMPLAPYPIPSTVMPTAAPTLSSISFLTPLGDSIKTPTALPTETPGILPTLSPDEAKSLVLELTQGDQDCLLPCFWGIMPGETEWQNAEAFLSTFAYRVSYGAAEGTFSDAPVGDSFIAWMSLFLPEMSSTPFSYAFDVQDGIVTMVDAAILPVSNNTLSTILNEYGQPTEIWLLTANAPMDDVLGFSLTLYYAQHHFILEYNNWDGEIIDGKVRGCLSGEESLRLVTWSPEEELTFAETVEGLHRPRRPIIYDLPLEEATGMSVDAFYETFKNSTEPICLETPTELWPGP